MPADSGCVGSVVGRSTPPFSCHFTFYLLAGTGGRRVSLSQGVCYGPGGHPMHSGATPCGARHHWTTKGSAPVHSPPRDEAVDVRGARGSTPLSSNQSACFPLGPQLTRAVFQTRNDMGNHPEIQPPGGPVARTARHPGPTWSNDKNILHAGSIMSGHLHRSMRERASTLPGRQRGAHHTATAHIHTMA